jgi:hypothetical protein
MEIPKQVAQQGEVVDYDIVSVLIIIIVIIVYNVRVMRRVNFMQPICIAHNNV